MRRLLIILAVLAGAGLVTLFMARRNGNHAAEKSDSSSVAA